MNNIQYFRYTLISHRHEPVTVVETRILVTKNKLQNIRTPIF